MLRKIVEICRAGGLGTGAAFLLCLGGCATIKPDKKIDEAIDLVETSTGQRPDWMSPWDVGTPAWDEQSILGIDQAVGRAIAVTRSVEVNEYRINHTRRPLPSFGWELSPTNHNIGKKRPQLCIQSKDWA